MVRSEHHSHRHHQEDDSSEAEDENCCHKKQEILGDAIAFCPIQLGSAVIAIGQVW
jgi:hypothetical protein